MASHSCRCKRVNMLVVLASQMHTLRETVVIVRQLLSFSVMTVQRDVSASTLHLEIGAQLRVCMRCQLPTRDACRGCQSAAQHCIKMSLQYSCRQL